MGERYGRDSSAWLVHSGRENWAHTGVRAKDATGLTSLVRAKHAIGRTIGVRAKVANVREDVRTTMVRAKDATGRTIWVRAKDATRRTIGVRAKVATVRHKLNKLYYHCEPTETASLDSSLPTDAR